MTLYSKRARKLLPVLSVLIPFGALISLVNVVVCMSTGSWLHSYERIPISNSTSTHEEFLIKRTISGLWHIWSFNLTEQEVASNREGKMKRHCKRLLERDENLNCFIYFLVPTANMEKMTIEHLKRDKYFSDPNDSTNAIARKYFILH